MAKYKHKNNKKLVYIDLDLFFPVEDLLKVSCAIIQSKVFTGFKRFILFLQTHNVVFSFVHDINNVMSSE